MKSGIRGKVHLSDPNSPLQSGSVSASDIADEVTRFTINETVAKRSYPHDKSLGWTVNCYGARTLEITLEAAIRYSASAPSIPSCGQKVYLELYPLGVGCRDPICGWAGVDRVSQVCDEGANGEPIGYVATLTSEGPWTGLSHHEAEAWGGFEDGCDDVGSDGASVSGAMRAQFNDESDSGDEQDAPIPAARRGLRG